MAERRAPRDGAATALHFMGPPGRLRLASGDDASAAAIAAVHLPGPLRKSTSHAVLRGRPGASRLRLPAGTPPGEYTVEIERGDGKREKATLSVAARPRLSVVPGVLVLVGAPGAKAAAALALANRGNAPVTVEAKQTVGVFEDDGIEAALSAAYRLDSDDVNQIVGTLFGRLREAHGGLMALRVVAGSGVLAPGDRRTVQIETVLPTKLRPGREYHGTLDIGPHTVGVQVQVAAADAPKARGGSR